MQNARIGDKIKKNLAPEVSSQLKNLLPPDEKIVGIFNATAIKPLIEAVVITNARIVCVVKDFPDGWKYVKELHKSDIKSLSAKRTKLSNFIYTPLKVRTKDDKEHKYVDVRKDEADEIVKLIGGISGSPERLSSVLEKRREVVTKHNEEHEALERTTVGREEPNSRTEPADKWAALAIGKVNKASIREVEMSCRPGEMPEFILGDGINGVLAAFNDRCIVIKKGIGTSLMAGSLGGGRVATFSYRDITGIEYNSGIMTGVLEILTASYTGKATNSPWQFGNDRSAHESSNTLPWGKIFYNQVRPQIEWIQQKIHEAKSVGTQQVVAQVSSSDELTKLAALHKQGILTDKEFAEAKQKILGKL